MEIMVWAFGGVAALAVGIIAVAAYVVFWRDRDAKNTRTKPTRRGGKVRHTSPGRGGPTRR
ncbi:hypothetical protein [Hasllibacter sp. MH4015]|uniref:hypothetical protein n=1 Tax=Hasllibacter sp. MH4015 TaxID=2854029 RepID=UPI001CD2650A|nr:hypothetical protein [Hasllibacter sp. MH4015]